MRLRKAKRACSILAACAIIAATPAVGQSAAELRDLASNFGLTPQQARSVFAMYDAQASRIAGLAAANKLDKRLLRSAALRLGAANPNLSGDEFIRLVEGKADQAREAQDKIARLEALVSALQQGDARTQAVAALQQARQAFDEGRLNDAEKALAALEKLRESNLADARGAWRDSVFAQIDLLALAGENERASELAQRAAQLVMDQARHDSWEFAMADARQWFERATLFGDRPALERSIQIFQTRALPLAPADSAPLDWARTQNNLGNAFLVMGERGDMRQLQSAVTAYRGALQKVSRQSAPDEWAMAEGNLCGALLSIGAVNDDAKLLEDAAAACRASLEATPKGTSGWSATQTNLSAILIKLGQIKGDVSIIAEGLRARAAASESGEGAPSPIAEALGHSDYGDLLVQAGEGEEAAEQYRLALKDLSRERYPMDWARAQNGLGNALQNAGRLGWSPEEREALEQAVASYRLALEAYRRDNAPLYWALVQRNLGSTLAKLGEEYLKGFGRDELGRQKFAESIAAYRLSMDGYSGAGAQAERLRSQTDLGCTLVRFGLAENRAAHLDEAVPILEGVIKDAGVSRNDGQITDGDRADLCLRNVQSFKERQSSGRPPQQ